VVLPPPDISYRFQKWEVFGIGTIYPGEGGPHIHYHASVGRSGHALTGCIREKAITYLIIEAVILEFTGLSARREFDKKTQVHLPVLGKEDVTSYQRTIIDAESTGSVEESQDENHDEKKELIDDLPGGLAEIIRDLTGNNSS